jgi:hypothetical protein
MEDAELSAVIAAARGTMPADTTHVVEIRTSTTCDRAYVLLAAEVVGTGGGFADRTLEELRHDPPPPSLVEGRPCGASRSELVSAVRGTANWRSFVQPN